MKLGWGTGNATALCCKPDARPAVVVESARSVTFTALRAKRDVSANGPGYDVGLRHGAQGTVVNDSPGIVVRKEKND